MDHRISAAPAAFHFFLDAPQLRKKSGDDRRDRDLSAYARSDRLPLTRSVHYRTLARESQVGVDSPRNWDAVDRRGGLGFETALTLLIGSFKLKQHERLCASCAARAPALPFACRVAAAVRYREAWPIVGEHWFGICVQRRFVLVPLPFLQAHGRRLRREHAARNVGKGENARRTLKGFFATGAGIANSLVASSSTEGSLEEALGGTRDRDQGRLPLTRSADALGWTLS